MPIEICQLAGQLDQVQKHIFEHLPRRFIISVIMVFKSFIYVLYFIFIFYVISHENRPKIKLKHNMVLFGLYNPKIFRAFQTIKSETSDTVWIAVFNPRFGRFVVYLMHFLLIGTLKTFPLTVFTV